MQEVNSTMANMAKAFILIETVVGRTKEVVAGLNSLEGVKSVDTVTGPYDVIAIIEADSLNHLNLGRLFRGLIKLYWSNYGF